MGGSLHELCTSGRDANSKKRRGVEREQQQVRRVSRVGEASQSGQWWGVELAALLVGGQCVSRPTIFVSFSSQE